MNRSLVRLLPLLSVALLAAQEPNLTPTKAPKLRGARTQVGGVEVLLLAGDDHERGFAEGQLMAPEIRSVFRAFALSRQRLPDPSLWDRMLLPFARARAEFPPELRTQAEGIIAGMRARDPALLQVEELGRELTADDLLAGSLLIDFAGFGCSSVVVSGEQVDGGGPLVGRNLDYAVPPEMLAGTMLIVHARNGERHGFVSIGWPGMLGIVTAISDAGVSVAIHDVEAKARTRQRVTPRMIALRQLVERLPPGDDVANAGAELLRKLQFGYGGNAMLAWRADGERAAGAAVLEFDTNREAEEGVSIRLPEDGLLLCTNHHRTRAEPDDCGRYARILAAGGKLGDGLTPADLEPVIRAGIKEDTIHSAVFDLASLRLRIAFRRQPQDKQEWLAAERVHEVDLAALLRDAGKL